MEFENYAKDNAVKLKSEVAGSALISNRFKMWAKAYRPVFSEVLHANRILDFGCGAGEFLSFLRPQTQAELVGFDISPSQLARARENSRGISFVGSSQEIRGTFDIVFCHHVIEHIPDDVLPSFMSELSGYVGPQGKLVIATPNGLNPFAHTFYMATDRTHVRMHSVFTLAEVLRPVGFEIAGFHRELPQAYDLPTFAKTIVWVLTSPFAKLCVSAVAAGMRGYRFPLSMMATFFVVAARKNNEGQGRV